MANPAERLYKIERLIRERGHVSFKALLVELEVSPATLKRDFEYLRSRLGAPIVYDAVLNGYRLAEQRDGRHELPGLWFDQRELYALLMAHQLLSGLGDQGTLSRHLQPLLERIHQLLGTGDEGDDSLLERVRIVAAAQRPVAGRCFETVTEALVRRRRLHLRYLTRARRETGERDVSPQRLVHYRNTWYLDAWCHRAQGLRRFALDAMQEARVLDQAARSLPMKTVKAEMDAGYGIYAGGTRRWARLAFAAHAAQWTSRELWHPEQQGRWLEDGRYELTLPYLDDTELVMDVLRHGDEVEVLEPPELREKVARRLGDAAAAYR